MGKSCAGSRTFIAIPGAPPRASYGAHHAWRGSAACLARSTAVSPRETTTSSAASEAVRTTPREGRALAASNSSATGGAAFECILRCSGSSRPLLTLATPSATAGIGPRGFENTLLTTSNGFEVSTASHHSPAPAHEDICSAAAARAQVENYETLALGGAFRALPEPFPRRSVVLFATAR